MIDSAALFGFVAYVVGFMLGLRAFVAVFSGVLKCLWCLIFSFGLQVLLGVRGWFEFFVRRWVGLLMLSCV